MKYTEFTIARADTGAVLPYARITVTLNGSAAALFNSVGGSIGNPVTGDVNGKVGFAAANGTYVLSAVSADGTYSVPPVTVQIFDLQLVANALAAGTVAGMVSKTKATQALLYADLAAADGSLGLVYADGTAINNDIYVKVGASGAGSWSSPTGLFVTATVDARAAATAAAAAASATQPLFTQHPVSRFIGVATPAAGAGNNFGAHFALAKAMPAFTVLEGFDFYLSSAANVNLYVATATNQSGGFATGTSVFTLGANIGNATYGTGLNSLNAAALAPLGDLSGKFIVLVGQCEYANTGPATGDEQWVTIDTGTLAASLAQQATRKIQMKVRYHTSDDHTADTLDYTGLQIIAALANQPSANTLALKTAIRNYGFFPEELSRAVVKVPNDIPTVTVGAAGAVSTINGNAASNPSILLSDSRIKWLAGVAVLNGGTGCWKARGAFYGAGSYTNQYSSWETVHTGTTFEVSLLGNFQSASNNIRLLVNDREVAITGLPQDGSFHMVKFVFPVSATRRIRFEGDSGEWRGINVASSSEVSASGRVYPLATFMGTSFDEGTGATKGWGGEAVVALRGLGFNPAVAGVGGTGMFTATAPRVVYTDTTRMLDLSLSGVTDALSGLTVTPALGILSQSQNDDAAGTLQQNKDKCWTLVDAYLTANTGKPLIILGPTWPSGTPPLTVYDIRDAGREVAAAARKSNVHYIDKFGPLNLLRSGVSNVSTDQAYLYTLGSGDPTHPNQRGHNYDGQWMAGQVRRLILSEFA